MLALGVGVPGAVASGVARGSGDGTPIFAARAFAWSARAGWVTRDVGWVTRDGAFWRGWWWPPCHPAAVVTATIRKAKTPVSR